MAKAKLKFEPGVMPRTATEITREYIQLYVAHGVKAGEIKPEKLDKWIADLEKIEAGNETPMKKFASIRKTFIASFMPQLMAKSNTAMSDFFKALKNQ